MRDLPSPERWAARATGILLCQTDNDMTKPRQPGAQPGNQNAAKPDADKLVEHGVNVTQAQKQYLLHIGSVGLRRLLDATMAVSDYKAPAPAQAPAARGGRRPQQS